MEIIKIDASYIYSRKTSRFNTMKITINFKERNKFFQVDLNPTIFLDKIKENIWIDILWEFQLYPIEYELFNISNKNINKINSNINDYYENINSLSFHIRKIKKENILDLILRNNDSFCFNCRKDIINTRNIKIFCSVCDYEIHEKYPSLCIDSMSAHQKFYL